MADDKKTTKILRDAEGFPFPDEAGPSRQERDAPNALLAGTVPGPRVDTGDGSRDGASEGGPDDFDNPDFNFEDCAPEEAGLAPPEPCQVCIKNPCAFVPDWKRLADGEVLFDETQCLYRAVVYDLPYVFDELAEDSLINDLPIQDYRLETEGQLLAVKDVDTGEVVKTVEEVAADREEMIRRVGLERIFKFANKKMIVPAVEYIPSNQVGVYEETGEFALSFSVTDTGKYSAVETDIDMVQELLDLKSYTDEQMERGPLVVHKQHHVSVRPNVPDKFLVSVPVEFIINLPDVVGTNATNVPIDEPLSVQFMGNEIKQKFNVMANNLNGAMMVYHRQYQHWIRLGGGVFKRMTYNPTTEKLEATDKLYKLKLNEHAEKMRDFLDALSEMLSYQNLVIPGFGFSLRTQAPTVEKVIVNIENIDGYVGGRLRIKNVKANKKGCETVVFGPNRPATGYIFNQFEKQFRDSTLLAYIGQVPNMCISSEARDPTEWFDWVTEYTYPPIEVEIGINTENMDLSAVSCALGSIADPIEDILRSLGEDHLGKVLKNVMGEALCMTPEELENELKRDREETKAAKKEAEKAKEVFEEARAILREAKDELRAAQKADRQESRDQAISPDTGGEEEDYVSPTVEAAQRAVDQAQEQFDRAKEDLRNKRVFLSKDLTEKLGSASGITYEIDNFLATDPILNKLPKLLAAFAKKGKGSNKKLFTDVIAKLGPCGMFALMSKAMECLLKGMDFNPQTQFALVEAAMNAMDDAHVEKLFIGLPDEDKQKVMDQVKAELGDVKAPWEDPYRQGAGSGKVGTQSSYHWNKEDLNNQALVEQGGFTEEELQALAEKDKKSYNQLIKDNVTGEQRKDARKARRAEASEALFDLDSGEVLPTGGIQESPQQGSFAAAANNIQSVIIKAYVKAMLDNIGVDYLFAQLEDLPGAKLIAEIIKDVPCNKPPPWRVNPPGNEFFKFEKLDPCDLMNIEGTWMIPPRVYIKKPVNAMYIPRLLWYILKEVAEQMLYIAIIMAMKKILEILSNLICLALQALGAGLADLLTGSNKLRELFANDLCSNPSDPEKLEESMMGLINNIGGSETDCLQSMDPAEMGVFVDNISAALLQNEILTLLNGTASDETLNMVTSLAAISGSPCIAEIFGDPNNVMDLFRNLGNVIDTTELQSLVEQLENQPISMSPNICADPLALANLDNIRCYLLTGKGLTEEECQEQIDDLKDQMLQDLSDLADIMHGNCPIAPAQNSSGPNLCGPEDGVFPYNSAASLEASAAITDAMFEDLAVAHTRDLLGAGGFITMLMADSNGKGIRAHNFFVRFFGASQAKNLPLIGFYCDDAINLDNGQTVNDSGRGAPPVDAVSGKQRDRNSLEADGYSLFNKIPGVNVTTGGLPPTIANYLKNDLANLNTIFKTTIVPEGYASYAKALDEAEKIRKHNDRVYARRSDYIEAWIDEYDIESKKGDKRFASAFQMREAIKYKEDKPIFYSESDVIYDEEGYPVDARVRHHEKGIVWEDDDAAIDGMGLGMYSKNTPEYLASEVLRGRQILGGTGHKLDVVDGKLGDKWSDKNRERAAKNLPNPPPPETGNQEKDDRAREKWEKSTPRISDYFLKNLDHNDWEYKKVLKPSVADLRLEFEDYMEEYSLRVEYDHNPVDTSAIPIAYPVSTGLETDEFGRQYRRDQEGNKFFINEKDPYVLAIYEKFIPRNPVENAKVPQVEEAPTELDTGTKWIQTHRIQSTPVVLADPDVDQFLNEKLDIMNEFEKPLFGQSGFEVDKVAISKRGMTFATMIKRAILDNVLQHGIQTDPVIELANLQRTEVFDSLSNFYVKAISKRISQNTRSFKYGFDASVKPKIDILDWEKYGGTSEAPPFYINPPSRDGWMGLLDDILPEWDGCEPRRTDLIDFASLKELVDQRNASLVDDPRLEGDPLCVEEAPYDKLMSKYTAASLEGMVAATFRIYISEMMLQAMPVFSLFYSRIPEVFDDVFLSYVVENMEKGCIDEGTKFNLFKGQVVDKSYWYQFVEQAVMSFIRRLPEEYNPAGTGEITDLTPDEIKAYNNIQAAIETFYHIEKYEYDGDGRGYAAMTDNAINGQSLIKRVMEARPTSVRLAKGAPQGQFSRSQARGAKELAFETILEETMDDAKIILRRLAREEFERLAEKFNDTIKPSIYSMDALLLGNSDFVDGSLTDNNGNNRLPPDVDPRDAGGTPHGAPLSRPFELSGKPFVLQKYIKIIDKQNPDPAINEGRTEDMYHVVNIDTWDRHVKNLKNAGLTGNISDYWGSGFTTQVDEDPESPTYQQNIQVGESGWKFGLRLCYVPDRDTDLLLLAPGAAEGALARPAEGDETGNVIGPGVLSDPGISPELAMNQKAFLGEDALIPIAHGELEIPDQEFTNFDPDSYDIDCLVRELVKDPAYKTLFDYCFPLKTFLSTLTIYCVKAFVPSIGNTGTKKGDNWVTAGGNPMSGFRRWDTRAEPFRKSTKKARQLFETLYNSTIKDNSYRDRNDAGPKEKWYNRLKPKWNYDLGLRWWMMPRKRSRPYDKDGNECE